MNHKNLDQNKASQVIEPVRPLPHSPKNYLWLMLGIIFITLFQAFPAMAILTSPGKPYHVNSLGRDGYEIDNLVQFMWSEVANAQYYNVYMSVNGSAMNFTATSSGNSFSFNASNGFKYNIAVAAVDSSNVEGSMSATSMTVICDLSSPTVKSSVPYNGAKEIETSSAPAITFSEAMSVTDLYLTGVISLYENSQKVDTELAYDVESAILSVTPKNGYKHGLVYKLEISTGAKDLAGNGLADKFSLAFTTIAAERLTLERLLAYPSPARGRGTSLTYVLSQNVDEVVIEVYHVGGDRVRMFDDAPTSEGYNERYWDLKTDDGDDVPNGLYYFRVKGKLTSTGEYLETSKYQKLLVLR